MSRRPKLTPEQAAEVRDMYRGPWSIGQIARFFKVDPAIIHRVLDRKGAYAAKPMSDRQRELEAAIAGHGYTLIYQEYCECPETPGFLGQIRGVTDHKTKRVRISRLANPNQEAVIDILAHELHHIEDRNWDCGCRAPWHRGGD